MTAIIGISLSQGAGAQEVKNERNTSDDAAPASGTASARPAGAGAPAAQQALPVIAVRADAADDDAPQHLSRTVSAGALGARSQLDTPFSMSVVTRQDIEDAQPAKLGDLFAADASVSDNSDANSAWASYITIRGMPIDWQNGFKIDGQPFISYGISLPYEQLERVDLLKGLGGFMYGFASPGGIVNYVTKKPPTDVTPVRSVDLGYRNDGVWSEHADLGGRFGR
ncbi:MAG: TonB-dependent receptor plug domain-containing protein, partial [Janthinobacterium lividum]